MKFVEKIYNYIIPVFLAVFTLTRLVAFFVSFDINLNLIILIAYFSSFYLLYFLLITKCNIYRNFNNIYFYLLLILGVMLDRSEMFSKTNIISLIGSGIFFAYFIEYLAISLKNIFPIKFCNCVWVIIIINLIAIVYITNTHIIYYWDNAGYWNTSSHIAERLFKTGFYDEFIYSIYFDDYNYLIALPVAIVMKIFGSGRMIYILSIVNIYLIPCIILIFSLCKTKLNAYVTLLVVFAMVYITLIGFIDIGAMLIALLCFYVYKLENINIKNKYFLLGILPVFSFVLRRYFIFFAIAFLICLFITEFAFNKRKEILIIPCSAIFTAFFFMQPFLTQKLSTNPNLYEGYKLLGNTDYFLFARYFGVLVLLFIILIGLLLISKKDKTAIVSLGTAALCYLLFIMIQSHGQQHLLLYIPSVIMLITAFVNENYNIAVKKLTLSLLILNLSINTIYFKKQPDEISKINSNSPLPSYSFHPIQNTNIQEIMAVKMYLDSLAKKSEKSVAVLASSFEFNSDLLRNIYKSYNILPPKNEIRILDVPQVDGRDKATNNLFDADYVVVCDPPQIHLEAKYQSVITLPSQAFLDGDYGNTYIKHKKEFEVSKIRVLVFEKIN